MGPAGVVCLSLFNNILCISFPNNMFNQCSFKKVKLIKIQERIELSNTSFADQRVSHFTTRSMGPDRVELSEEPPHIYYSTVLQTAVRSKTLNLWAVQESNLPWNNQRVYSALPCQLGSPALKIRHSTFAYFISCPMPSKKPCEVGCATCTWW